MTQRAKITFEKYQAMSEAEQIAVGVSQALGVMAAADAVIITDDEGNHWEVSPENLFSDTEAKELASGFAELRKPFNPDGSAS